MKRTKKDGSAPLIMESRSVSLKMATLFLGPTTRTVNCGPVKMSTSAMGSSWLTRVTRMPPRHSTLIRSAAGAQLKGNWASLLPRVRATLATLH